MAADTAMVLYHSIKTIEVLRTLKKAFGKWSFTGYKQTLAPPVFVGFDEVQSRYATKGSKLATFCFYKTIF